MSPRIVVYSDVFPPRHGGSGRWLWELYRRLDVPVHVLAGAADGDAAFDRADALPIERVARRFRGWGMRALPAYLRTARELAAACRRFQATVVHCGRCLPEGLVAVFAGAWSGRPFWCYAHGEELTLAATSRELAWLTRAVLRRTAGIVANSAHTKRMLVERWGVAPDHVVVLTPGVDCERFRPAPRDERLRAEFGWTGRRVVLTVGALQQRKGQDMMIRALADIRRHVPDVLYAVAGEGWERQRLEALAKTCGVVDLVDFRGVPGEESLVQLYQQCDLFALPNRQVGWDLEGFGIVLIEAQACGVPVLTGASGGAPETVEPGQTGVVVACDTPDALARAVVALLSDAMARQRMGRAARERACAHFDWQVLVPRARAAFGCSADGELTQE